MPSAVFLKSGWLPTRASIAPTSANLSVDLGTHPLICWTGWLRCYAFRSEHFLKSRRKGHLRQLRCRADVTPRRVRRSNKFSRRGPLLTRCCHRESSLSDRKRSRAVIVSASRQPWRDDHADLDAVRALSEPTARGPQQLSSSVSFQSQGDWPVWVVASFDACRD